MSKLAARFDDYTSILRRLRTGYFRLTSRLSEGELFHLARAESDEDRKRLWDGFLDAWTAWKRERGTERLEELRAAVDALREIEPDFAFELPEA